MRYAFAIRIAPILFLLGFLTSAQQVTGEYRETNVSGGGEVTGRIFFDSDYPPPETIRPDRDADTCGIRMPSETFVVDKEGKGLANVIVRLEGVTVGKPFADAEPKIDQIKCRYEPHVTVVRPGKPFNIFNQDPILHNVHAYRGDDTVFNLAQPFQGQATPQTLGDEGLIRVKCDVHSWMEAWVLVINNPYFAITDAQGSYNISEVPPGSYKVTMWHEALGEASKQVSVTSGQASEVDFSIGE